MAEGRPKNLEKITKKIGKSMVMQAGQFQHGILSPLSGTTDLCIALIFLHV